jgi:hypothetical protein
MILAREEEVGSRLEELGVSRADLLHVVQAAVGARRSATGFHPASAGGLLSWIEGTAQLRRMFVPQGWEVCRRENIESIFNPATKIKVIFQNAEQAGDPVSDPVAASKKGAGSARAVESGQYELFPAIREREVAEVNAPTWCLFVYVDGDDVRAEFSCPRAIIDEQFDGFHERILLLQRGEWATSDPLVDHVPPMEFEVPVSRKD